MSEFGSFYWGWEATKEVYENWSRDSERPGFKRQVQTYLHRFSAWLKHD